VALCVLLLLFVLTIVESVTADSSKEWGLQTVDSVVRRQFSNATTGENISAAVTRQVRIWSQQGYDWGTGRTLLYLDLHKLAYCDQYGGGLSCDRTTPGTWGSKRTSLVGLDDMVKAQDIRLIDIEFIRYPGYWDDEITIEELEEKVTSVALFNKRIENEEESLRSIWTTLIVTVIILTGITMLTKDLTFLSKNLLKPLVELADEMESITRLQLAAVANPNGEAIEIDNGTSEVRLIRRTFENMKKAIKSWGKYVPWPVVQLMLRKDAEAMIDVTEKEVSIYFSDIAGFTTIVESLPPESSLLLLSRYFHDMSKIIDEYGGIVLEFIGDAIMSIYGAPVTNPDHATAAVKAARRMLDCLRMMNVWFAERNLPQVSIRCGVHTGKVLVGNMGFQQRMKYGVVGEESNVPGHLEESNKNYATEMLISERTYNCMNRDAFIVRPIDYMNLLGTGAQPIYQVMDRSANMTKDASGGPTKRMAAETHTAAMACYRGRNFEEAIEKFEHVGTLLQDVTGEKDEPSAMMVRRCRSYINDPPAANWEGLWDRPEPKN